MEAGTWLPTLPQHAGTATRPDTRHGCHSIRSSTAFGFASASGKADGTSHGSGIYATSPTSMAPHARHRSSAVPTRVKDGHMAWREEVRHFWHREKTDALSRDQIHGGFCPAPFGALMRPMYIGNDQAPAALLWLWSLVGTYCEFPIKVNQKWSMDVVRLKVAQAPLGARSSCGCLSCL